MHNTLTVLSLETHNLESNASIVKKSKIYKHGQASVDDQSNAQDSEQDTEFPGGLITFY